MPSSARSPEKLYAVAMVGEDDGDVTIDIVWADTDSEALSKARWQQDPWEEQRVPTHAKHIPYWLFPIEERKLAQRLEQ